MQTQPVNRTQRQLAEAKYRQARSNMLVMVLFTLMNIVLYLTGSNTMMLFSATVPYLFAIVAMDPQLISIRGVLLAITFGGVLVYFLCWLFSKKRPGWILAALILFVLDTLAMLAMYIAAGDFSAILDIVLHAFVLYYLFLGVKYGNMLKKLPEDPVEAPAQQADGQPAANTTPLRYADMEEKHRVLLETEAEGCRICYRRVKKVNELVINGHVYAELEMGIEPPHELTAVYGGHQICAGYDGSSSYIAVDGRQVAKKLRLY